MGDADMALHTGRVMVTILVNQGGVLVTAQRMAVKAEEAIIRSIVRVHGAGSPVSPTRGAVIDIPLKRPCLIGSCQHPFDC